MLLLSVNEHGAPWGSRLFRIENILADSDMMSKTEIIKVLQKYLAANVIESTCIFKACESVRQVQHWVLGLCTVAMQYFNVHDVQSAQCIRRLRLEALPSYQSKILATSSQSHCLGHQMLSGYSDVNKLRLNMRPQLLGLWSAEFVNCLVSVRMSQPLY